ncbi:MAG: hypothetical protein ACLSGS_12340 [Adlercreutzia sp.]
MNILEPTEAQRVLRGAAGYRECPVRAIRRLGSHHRGGRRGQGAPAGRGGGRRAADLPEELLRIVTLLPPGDYTRQRLCTQLNSAIAGHAWGQVYGTVE